MKHADCRVFHIWRNSWQHQGDGRIADFYEIRCRHWVVALALTPARELLLVQQFRFGSGRLCWEFPAGCLDPGEDPLHAATRELHEETGFSGRCDGLLGSYQPNPALQGNWCYFVGFRQASRQRAPAWDEHEEIAVRLEPLETVARKSRAGIYEHSLVANALWAAQDWLARA